MDQELINYIKSNIFPEYEKYYSHGMIHISNVIKNSLELGKEYGLDENMCYTMAAYHDLGLKVDRKNHELESGKIFENDAELKKYFTDDELRTMKEAIEDHRGSRKEAPRNIYGKVLSDSDRDFDIELLAKRQLATSIKNFPDYTTFEEHFENCYAYISKRITDTGHFNLWTNNARLLEKRDKFEKDFFNKEYTKSVYSKEYNRISADGTIEKIKSYYIDY